MKSVEGIKDNHYDDITIDMNDLLLKEVKNVTSAIKKI
jgi:hypothetical protein